MGRLTFDDLTPDDMPEPYVEHWGDRADAYRDSLGDLVGCGNQTTPRTPMTLQQYLASIKDKIEAEARAHVAEHGGDLDSAIEGITDEYGQGFADDADARKYGDYPYDGSFEE